MLVFQKLFYGASDTRGSVFALDKAMVPGGNVTKVEDTVLDPMDIRLDGVYGTKREKEVLTYLQEKFPCQAPWAWDSLRAGPTFFEPKVIQEDNYFNLIEETSEKIWLQLEDGKTAQVGEVVRVRERGGFQKMLVAEVSEAYGRFAIRGEWIEGDYLPVEEFLEDLDRKARAMGAPV